RLPGNLREVSAEGVGGELRLWISEGGRRLAIAAYYTHVGALQHVSEVRAIRGAVGFHKHPSILKIQIVWVLPRERRSWRRDRNHLERSDRTIRRGPNSRHDRCGSHRTAGDR